MSVVTKTFAIAASGTESNYINMPDHRLVGLIIPTMDSTTITFKCAVDDAGGSAQAVKTNAHGAAPATLNLGTADTGARASAVPEEVGRLAATAFLAIVVASQTGAARSIIGLFQKD